jgi:hypothetical protein
MIPIEESFAAWRKDPKYVKAYDALEDEFSLPAAIIEARVDAGFAQAIGGCHLPRMNRS